MANEDSSLAEQVNTVELEKQAKHTKRSKQRAAIITAISIVFISALFIHQSSSMTGLKIDGWVIVLLALTASGLWRIWFNPLNSDETDKTQTLTYGAPMFAGVRMTQIFTSSNLRRFFGYALWFVSLVGLFGYLPRISEDYFEKALSDCQLQASATAYSSDSLIITQENCLRDKGYSSYSYGDETSGL